MVVGVLSVAAGLVAGTAVGLVAGLAPGRGAGVLMRAMDALLVFPSLVLALTITATTASDGDLPAEVEAPVYRPSKAPPQTSKPARPVARI